MKKTIFLSVLAASIIILSLAGVVQSRPSVGPFKAIWQAINQLREQVSSLFEQTSNLQNQIDSIDAPAPPTPPQPMAFDAFLQIESVPGESQDEGHVGWIEVVSYSYSMSPAGHGEFKVTKMVDKASPKLALYASGGHYIEEVILEAARPNGMMRYNMSNVVVKQLDKASPKLAQSLGSGGGGSVYEPLPLEEVSFTYGRINWTYTLLDGSGIQTGWDTVESRPLEEVSF